MRGSDQISAVVFLEHNLYVCDITNFPPVWLGTSYMFFSFYITLVTTSTNCEINTH